MSKYYEVTVAAGVEVYFPIQCPMTLDEVESFACGYGMKVFDEDDGTKSIMDVDKGVVCFHVTEVVK